MLLCILMLYIDAVQYIYPYSTLMLYIDAVHWWCIFLQYIHLVHRCCYVHWCSALIQYSHWSIILMMLYMDQVHRCCKDKCTVCVLYVMVILGNQTNDIQKLHSAWHWKLISLSSASVPLQLPLLKYTRHSVNRAPLNHVIAIYELPGSQFGIPIHNCSYAYHQMLALNWLVFGWLICLLIESSFSNHTAIYLWDKYKYLFSNFENLCNMIYK